MEPPSANRSTVHYIVNGGDGATLVSVRRWRGCPSRPRPTRRITPIDEAVSQKDSGANADMEASRVVVDDRIRCVAVF